MVDEIWYAVEQHSESQLSHHVGETNHLFALSLIHILTLPTTPYV